MKGFIDPHMEPLGLRRKISSSHLSRSESSLHDGPIIIGICAMEKKARSAPMMEILERISAFTCNGVPEFRVLRFPEDIILNKPIDEWPICQALIAFFSTGFPLRKAQAYASLRRPHVFNNLEKQEFLLDRRRVYAMLQASGVPVPKYVSYDANDKSVAVEDSDEWLQINGVRIQKPLVEKPISGEDHNIYIYYPRSQGGGSKRCVHDAAWQNMP
mgnify:CR=1 FL=1